MGSFSVGVNELEKLTSIESKIDELLASQNPSSLDFNLLTLNPTYQSNSSDGWATAPANLQALYDNDESSASNLFGIRFDVAWSWGEVVMIPGISIPAHTRIQFKVGIRNSGNAVSLFELAAFSVPLSSYVNIWNYYGAVSNSNDLIVNIDVGVHYVWDKLRFKLTHARDFAPQARFYDLKVYEVA